MVIFGEEEIDREEVTVTGKRLGGEIWGLIMIHFLILLVVTLA